LSHIPDGTQNDEIRAVSKALFGSRYRLEAANAVATGGDVLYAREIAQRLAVGDNQAQLELRHFEGAGLLLRLDRVAGQRQQYYQRRDSEFWRLARALYDEVVAAVATTS
jgi:predicted component of type VI protein secretion system